ncbi:MAG TPA: peptide ABC transporter substrate-binding protein [Gammaproteobacteria bacterium]|nr:peptide ABC transporter substrate-binding protein [Gammaproteobacteria bacterium]
MVYRDRGKTTFSLILWAALFAVLLLALTGCGEGAWNNPHPAAERDQNTFYSSFSLRPKHLDPAQSYSSNEVVFTGQIYEPPLQYHYLKRPYTLTPLTATELPRPYFENAQGQRLPDDAPPGQIAFSVYEIHIQSGIRYQPHPAFAKDASGQPRYLGLNEADLRERNQLSDFSDTGTRELVAADYVYQIKRLAHPRLNSPIYGLMAEYIVGLRDYAKTLGEAMQGGGAGQDRYFLDLRKYPLPGAEVVDRYTYRIRLHGEYPQFVYWLAMPFFGPIPVEADQFYSQPGMKEKNLVLDWYPVGTGPYMLTVNNPNRQMVMERNPNFHGETYPTEGEEGDRKKGLLADAGKPIPFIDRVVFSLEKEDIPTWNKFLQGYYDASGITSDSFDQAIQVSSQGEVGLTDTMREKNIQLSTSVAASTYYMGFNMRDPVVGGLSERARKLRQAISIAVDYEEFISIFLNGRGIPAQGPLPPGIIGYQPGEAGVNPYVYEWVGEGPNGKLKRRAISTAKQLLADAGYPAGRDANTGKPLVIHLDSTGGGPDDKARFDWLRKQFAKIDLQLDIRSTDYNRFQEKMLKGTAQLFQWGWNADYPDPENFLFLLYGPNAKAGKNGENAANYENPEFDRLFGKMKSMPNGPQRLQLIHKMVDIVQRDAPWVWGLHPKRFSLYHAWLKNIKPNDMANNTLKYKRIDPQLRAEQRLKWNRPIVWPLVLTAVLLIVGFIPAMIIYRRKQHSRGVQ